MTEAPVKQLSSLTFELGWPLLPVHLWTIFPLSLQTYPREFTAFTPTEGKLTSQFIVKPTLPNTLHFTEDITNWAGLLLSNFHSAWCLRSTSCPQQLRAQSPGTTHHCCRPSAPGLAQLGRGGHSRPVQSSTARCEWRHRKRRSRRGTRRASASCGATQMLGLRKPTAPAHPLQFRKQHLQHFSFGNNPLRFSYCYT